MATYEAGDYVKVELTDEVAGGGEWLAEAALIVARPITSCCGQCCLN